MKKIVVASDSFKGSLTSLQVADAIEAGIHLELQMYKLLKCLLLTEEKVLCKPW